MLLKQFLNFFKSIFSSLINIKNKKENVSETNVKTKNVQKNIGGDATNKIVVWGGQNVRKKKQR